MQYTNIYTPSTLDEAKELAQIFATKNKQPLDLLRLHATFGHHFGSNMAITAQQGYVIRDTPALGADAMAGIVRNSGRCRFIKIESWDNDHCTIACARHDEPKTLIHEFTFNMEMATRQGIARGRMWESMPMQMLRARAMTMALRAVFPDVVSGIYSADEIADSTDLSEDERAEIQAESLGEEVKVKRPSRAPQPVPPPEPTQPPKPKAQPIPKAAPRPVQVPSVPDDAPVTIDFEDLDNELANRGVINEKQAMRVWRLYVPRAEFITSDFKLNAFYKLFCSPLGAVSAEYNVKIDTSLKALRELKEKDTLVFTDLLKRLDLASNDYLNEIQDEATRASRLLERWSNPIFAECNLAMNQGLGIVSDDVRETIIDAYHNESAFTDWSLWSMITSAINDAMNNDEKYDDIPF